MLLDEIKLSKLIVEMQNKNKIQTQNNINAIVKILFWELEFTTA